jgi:hypothetical protein
VTDFSKQTPPATKDVSPVVPDQRSFEDDPEIPVPLGFGSEQWYVSNATAGAQSDIPGTLSVKDQKAAELEAKAKTGKTEDATHKSSKEADKESEIDRVAREAEEKEFQRAEKERQDALKAKAAKDAKK